MRMSPEEDLMRNMLVDEEMEKMPRKYWEGETFLRKQSWTVPFGDREKEVNVQVRFRAAAHAMWSEP
jgi:hypothetical protein